MRLMLTVGGEFLLLDTRNDGLKNSRQKKLIYQKDGALFTLVFTTICTNKNIRENMKSIRPKPYYNCGLVVVGTLWIVLPSV